MKLNNIAKISDNSLNKRCQKISKKHRLIARCQLSFFDCTVLIVLLLIYDWMNRYGDVDISCSISSNLNHVLHVLCSLYISLYIRKFLLHLYYLTIFYIVILYQYLYYFIIKIVLLIIMTLYNNFIII